MQLHEISHKKKKKKRVGRGGKRGTYCGRGVKGQKARAGRKLQPIIRQILKKYPKLRGYAFKPTREKPEIVNLQIINQKFEEKEIVSPKTLLEKGIINRIKGNIPEVKILAKEEIKKKLIFKDCLFSEKAKEKIEKAGGEIK